MNKNILIEDLEILSSDDQLMNQFNNKTVLVTGATGLIGSLIVKNFIYYNHHYNGNIKIIASIRNEKKIENLYKGFDVSDVIFTIGDITDDFETYIKDKVDIIIHTASITTSKTMIDYPVETIDSVVLGTKQMLELAKNDNAQVVYLSSMEVYGKMNVEGKVKEDEMGYLNPSDIRSNYPLGKRMCENMCVAYHKEFGVDVKIARLAQTFGPGLSETDNRIYVQFARSVIDNENIVLHTNGESEGNYCYSRDALKGIYTILLKGVSPEAYNISNENNHTSIKNMAYMVANDIANNKIKVIFDIPKDNIYGYATPTKMKLDTGKIRKLGWNAEVNLQEQYERLIFSIKNANK